ncbi:LysR family transcriptional regulator [Variovorax sp. UC122_21]|uniref:LysR family transcriptional regulator n=1 Tax=Variovorax sp. UC122_21 TaxID=3374554 RepID=UPI0037576C32
MRRLELLSLFSEVVRKQSFAGAAREFGVTPSTVAKAVARLEESLGVRLFHRTTRCVTPTSDGERLFGRCRKVIDEMEALEHEMLGGSDRPVGVLRLDLPIVYGRQVVFPLLARLTRKHPELRFDVSLSDAFVDLVREGVDLAVRIGTMSDSGLVARRFSQQQWILCGSPGYLKEHGTPQNLKSLGDHRAIVFRMPTCGKDQAWRFKGNAHQRFPAPVTLARLTDGESMAHAAELGMGLAQLPDYMVADALAQGRLVEVLKSFRPAATPIHAILPSNRMVPIRVRLLLDELYQLDATAASPSAGLAAN